MNSKVSKYLIRIVLILLGLSVIGVTLFSSCTYSGMEKLS